jgi:hypothetical protein
MEFDLDKIFDEMFSIITPDTLNRLNETQNADLKVILGAMMFMLAKNLKEACPDIKFVRSGKYFQYPEWFKAKHPELFEQKKERQNA